jgi:hypothetical protein
LQGLTDLAERLRHRIGATEMARDRLRQSDEVGLRLGQGLALQILTQLFEVTAYLLILALDAGKL